MSTLTLIYGAAGEQGRPVAQELLRRGERVRLLLRHPEGAEALRRQGAEVLAGDLDDPASLERANAGVDRVALVLPLGGDAVGRAERAAQAARAAGVRRLVLNTSGPTPAAPTGLPALDARRALEATVLAAGIPTLILRPTAYLQNLLGLWTLPELLERGVLAYPLPEHHRVSWLAAEDLGPLTAEALARPEQLGALAVGGPQALSGPDLARGLTLALDRPVRYQALTPEDFGARLAGVFGPEVGRETTRAYRLGWDGPVSALALDMTGVLARLPVRLTPFAAWLQAQRAAFTLQPA